MKLGGMVPASGTFSPTTGVANWILESNSNTQLVAIQEVSMGGELTSSTAMRCRIARDSAVGQGGRSTGSVQRFDQATTTPGNVAYFCTQYGTTAPTVSAGALLPFSWNANGGYIRWLAAPGEELLLCGGDNSIECRQDVGTGQSSYGVVWTEF